MKPIDDKKETVTFRAVSADEEGRKRVEKTHNLDTLKHIEKKLTNKGLLRLDRHPRDGIPIEKLPKGGRGGKYTWDGPGGMVSDEMDPAPAAVDKKDPNYVSEGEGEGEGEGEDEEEEMTVARGGDRVMIGRVAVEMGKKKVAEGRRSVGST